MGVLTGTVTSGGVMDKMSKEGPTSGDLKGDETLFSLILYSSPAGGALRMGLNMQSLVWMRSQLR
jgi:hypothetical protein